MEMHVAFRQDSAEIDDLLSFVDDVGIGETQNDFSDSPWLDDLDELFKEVNPPAKLAVVTSKETTHIYYDVVAKDEFPKPVKTFTVPDTVSIEKKFSSRPRVSRKEKLEYLRLKVKEMESKLQELKDNSDTDRSPQPASSSPSPDNVQNSMQVEHNISLWKTMAQRQKNQRASVEVENAKLREKLKTQVRMAKSLKRILCKRTRGEDQMSNTTPKRTKPLSNGLNTTAALFDELLHCLDELYVKTDKLLAHSPIATMANPSIRKRDVKYNDAAGMFLEFQDSKIWPFDVRKVSQATWRFLTETGLKFNNYVEEHIQMRGNTMLRKFGVEFKSGSSVAVLFGRQVFRRYMESNRVVFVRYSVIDEIQLPGASTSGLTFRESGWLVMKNTVEGLGTGSATLSQGYSMMTPDIDLNTQWEIGTLTDFVLQSREDVEAGNDAIIENLLLEEANKPSNS